MKTVQEIIDYLQDRLAQEREDLQELINDKASNSVSAWMTTSSIDTLEDALEFIREGA